MSFMRRHASSKPRMRFHGEQWLSDLDTNQCHIPKCNISETQVNKISKVCDAQAQGICYTISYSKITPIIEFIKSNHGSIYFIYLHCTFRYSMESIFEVC